MHIALWIQTIEMLREPAFILDSASRLLCVGSKLRELLGLSEDRLIGWPVSRLYANVTSDCDVTSWRAQCPDPERRLLWLRSASRGRIPVEVSCSEVQVDGAFATLALLRVSTPEAASPLSAFERTIVDSFGIGLLEIDYLVKRVRGTPRVHQIYGLPGGQVLTTVAILAAIHESDRERVRREVDRALAGEGDGELNLLHRIRRPDGVGVRWVHARAHAEFGMIDGVRAPIRMYGAVCDVTEHQETLGALRRTEERLSTAALASQIGVFERWLLPDAPPSPEWSDTLRQLLGFPREAVPDVRWFYDRVHPDDGARVQMARTRALNADGKSPDFIEEELRWAHPDGTERWLLLRINALFEELAGERVAARIVGAVLDITERKLAEEERALRSAILDATPDFVAIADPEGNFIYLNKASRTFLGVRDGDEPGAYNLFAVQAAKSGEEAAQTVFETAMRAGLWTGEVMFVRSDGESVPMSQVLMAHRDHVDRVRYLSTIARDLSKEKLLEAQFLQAQKMEAIGRLAGGVAHDFNNLLSVILVSCEIMALDLGEAEGVPQELEQIQRAAERAAELTAQLLAFGRKQILQPRVVDVTELLTEFRPMVERLVDETIAVQMHVPADACRIKIDPTQMHQVLLNLIVNARDAMPTGGHLTLEAMGVRLEAGDVTDRLGLAAGSYVVVAVSDTGEGMDEATRTRIFEPFFSTKGPGRGTGLGLSTVFGIVHQSGGAIWVYSEPGLGTTFKLYFPRSDEAPYAGEPPNLPTLSMVEADGLILVAEDDAQLREMVKVVLQRAGYEVLSVANGDEALALVDADERRIDLLVTDVLMPGMTGKQLADRLLERSPTTAVLFMSGYTENSIVHHGILDPGVNFVAKPITPGRLLAAIQSALR